MAARIIACFRFLYPRKTLFLCLFGAAILCCGIASLRLTAHEDIKALIPDGDPQLSEKFSLMRDAPFLHTLNITVGSGSASGEVPSPQKLSDALARALASPEIPFIAQGPGAFAARDLPRLLTSMPALLTPEAIAALGEKLDRDSIRETLRADRRLLLGPSGPALRGLVAQDPLGAHTLLLDSLASLRSGGGTPVREGYFTDASGQYCMLIAKPAAAMTDAAASAAVMDRVRKALATLPPGVEYFVTGSYRHSEANAAIIKSDLNRVLPVSLVLIAALFLVFLRNTRALAILPVPLAALCAAGVLTAAFYGTVSGIVLGFGSVILGITADYAIHTYYAVTQANTVEKGIADVCPPLLAGACTTAFAFAALFFSHIPAIRQLGLFGLAAIGTALVASLLFLPLALRPRNNSGRKDSAAPSLQPRPLLMTVVFAVPVMLIAAASLTLRFDGDIRNLAYTAPEIAHDTARSEALWNMPREGAFIVAVADGTDAGFEKALHNNDRIAGLLRAAGIASSGLAPVLPSQERQTRSIAAWKKLWTERGDAVLKDLDALAPEYGFAPGAFSPFARWIHSEPPRIDPETLRGLGFAFLPAMLVNRTPEHSRIYTLLPGTGTPDAALLRDFQEAGTRYVSGSGFRKAMAESIRGDIFRFCLLTLIAVIIAVFLIFRSPLRCAGVLLPVLTGLAVTLSLFYAAGIAVNMFHAVALPLVIALSVDYGIFMQAVIEGRMDGDGKRGVLLSALTTLAGFGSLLLARHPALFSLGLAVTGGIAAAFVAAVWLQPRLFRNASLCRETKHSWAGGTHDAP